MVYTTRYSYARLEHCVCSLFTTRPSLPQPKIQERLLQIFSIGSHSCHSDPDRSQIVFLKHTDGLCAIRYGNKVLFLLLPEDLTLSRKKLGPNNVT